MRRRWGNNVMQQPASTEEALAWMALGAAAETASAPFERVRILLQTRRSSAEGVTDCLVEIVREQGFISLWRGNAVAVLSLVPMQAVGVALKDAAAKMAEAAGKEAAVGKWVGALAGGAATVVVFYPISMARVRLAADVGRNPKEREFSGPLDCLYKCFASDGLVGGLYPGISVALAGVVLYRAAVYFGTEEMARRIASPTYTHNFLLAVLAGTATFPLDTLCKRLMMAPANKERDKYPSGTLDCARRIWRDEGVVGFYRGYAGVILKGLASAAFFLTFKGIKSHVKL